MRYLGPLLPVHKIADINIAHALPELGEAERRQALAGMWDNLGRVFCEYPHLNDASILQAVEEVDGAEHLRDALAGDRPVFIFSGHLGNWELCPRVSAAKGMPLHLLYRAANNPSVDALLRSVRAPYTAGLYDKGKGAARAIIRAVQQHEPVAMLVDQKTSDGVMLPFFGMQTPTSDVVAHLVLKYQACVLPSRCIRLNRDCRFKVVVEPPLQFTLTGDVAADRRLIMDQVHDVLERWIRQTPDQWFWMHRRWPDLLKRNEGNAHAI